MNKCLTCKNLIMSKDKKRVSCKYAHGIVVYGQLGAEAIIDSCGHVETMREYERDSRHMKLNEYRS